MNSMFVAFCMSHNKCRFESDLAQTCSAMHGLTTTLWFYCVLQKDKIGAALISCQGLLNIYSVFQNFP